MPSSANTSFLRQGDRLPDLVAAFQNSDGQAIDLSTATGVTVHVVPEAGGAALINTAGTIDAPATAGIVRYALTPTDATALVAGLYRVEWVVTFAGGKQATFPNGPAHDYLLVTARLA